jgi:two-component system OmpR family response regulator
MTKVLMIEDDTELAEILTEYLAKFNIEVTNYETPSLGLSAINLKPYKLVILDLTLPEIDGLEVCKNISLKYNLPIIISSARNDVSDKVACLQMGADDYLPKPYDPRELVARIQSVLRRYETKEPKQESIFELNEDLMEILKNGKVLKLTPAEYGILSYLIKNKKRVVSRDEFLNNIDALSYDSSYKSIDVIVGRLRQKIEENPKKPQFLKSVRGVGYKLVE